MLLISSWMMHGLADAGAAEQADLAALGVGREQVDDLDAGDEDLAPRSTGRYRPARRLWIGAPLLVRDRAGLVDRLADDVHDAAERAVADRHRDRLAGVGDLLAAHQAFGGVHRDGAHGRFAEMLGDFEHQAVALVLGLQRVQDRRQVALELHVDDGADDLGDLSDCVGAWWPCLSSLPRSLSERLGAGDDLDQFLGDHRLAGAVVGAASACVIMSPALRVALSIALICAP